MAKVSVIIPAYNAEKYIEQCVNSLLQQTLKDLEIIIIDDGSTDKTGEILDCIKDKNPQIRLFHQYNHGLYKTREIGLAAATGEYIGWLDDDDFVEPDMYEALYLAAINNNSELALCDYAWYPEKIPTKEKWFRPYQGVIDTRFVERNSQPWNKIVKRELLDRLEVGKAFSTCFDEIYIQVLMEAKNPVNVRKELYHYRVSNGTMSSSYKNVEHYRRFVDASIALKDRMKNRQKSQYWNDYFEYRVIYYSLMTMLVSANAGEREAYSEMKKKLQSFKPQFRNNQHFHRILNENYGRVKAAVIADIIPAGYQIARLACIAGLR